MYIACIKIDETLPWIELKGTYQTKNEARKATREIMSNIKIKIVTISEEQKQMKALATIRR